jgi:hypothetical protein
MYIIIIIHLDCSLASGSLDNTIDGGGMTIITLLSRFRSTFSSPLQHPPSMMVSCGSAVHDGLIVGEIHPDQERFAEDT